mgnify:CR=1 FL=1|jgi:hypothetical protein
MKFIELLEGRGIAAREKAVDGGHGAVFVNDRGEKIELQDIIYFPPEGGRYEDDAKGSVEDPVKGRDKTQEAIVDWFSQSHLIDANDFKMVNAPSKAAAITIWKRDDGKHVAFGRYTTNVKPGALGINWTNSQFQRETGYASDDVSTKSEKISLKPSDLFTSEPMTIEELIEKVQDMPADVPEELKKIVPALLMAVANGEQTFIPGAAEHRAVIEKYVGEYAAAIAILTGNFTSGAYRDAEEKLLTPKGLVWSDMDLAQFPTSTTEALVDSYVLDDDQTARVAISSKTGGGGGGAAASLLSVAKILDTAQFKPAFIKKNEEVITGIKILAENSAKEGVYKLGKLFGFVSDKDIKIIEHFGKTFNKDETLLTTNLKKLVRTYPNPENVERTIMHPNYNLGYRLLAALARKVATKLNSQNPTRVFSEVLAKSPVIQVYAKTQKRGDALSFIDFNVVYPATFSGEILFDAESNFFSTQPPKGRMTFKMKK